MAGQGRYTAFEPDKYLHYNCHHADKDSQWTKRPTRVVAPNLAGTVAPMLAKELSRLLKRPVVVEPHSLWLQQRAGLGEKWDRAFWGHGRIEHPDIPGQRISLYGASTLAQCAVLGVEIVLAEGPATYAVRAQGDRHAHLGAVVWGPS